jgi:GAF domain-containing protein
LPDLLADVAHRLVTGFELQDCRFVFLDPDGQMGTLVDPGTSADSRQTLSEKSEATKLLETRIHAAGNAVLQDTLRQQKPLVLYGGVPHTALQELFSDEGPGPGPVIVAPLHSLGKTIGALAMAVANAGRHFEEDDLRLIEQISLQISGAIDVARLFEQTQQRAEREHLVAEITTRLRASNDPQQILKTAADELRRALRAKRAQVIVPTHDPSVESVQSGE